MQMYIRETSVDLIYLFCKSNTSYSLAISFSLDYPLLVKPDEEPHGNIDFHGNFYFPYIFQRNRVCLFMWSRYTDLAEKLPYWVSFQTKTSCSFDNLTCIKWWTRSSIEFIYSPSKRDVKSGFGHNIDHEDLLSLHNIAYGSMFIG
jgi:hypothetical protein